MALDLAKCSPNIGQLNSLTNSSLAAKRVDSIKLNENIGNLRLLIYYSYLNVSGTIERCGSMVN